MFGAKRIDRGVPVCFRSPGVASESGDPAGEEQAGRGTVFGLAFKIALVAFAIAFLGLVSVTFLADRFLTASSRDRTAHDLERRAWTLSRVIDARIAAALHEAQAVTRSEPVLRALNSKPGRAATPSASLDSLLTPELWEMAVTDARGRTVAASRPSEPRDHHADSWWLTAMDRGLYVGELGYDRDGRIWGLPLAVRIDDPSNGEHQGVLWCLYNWRILRDDVVMMARTSDSSFVWLVDGTGRVLISPGAFQPGWPISQAVPDASLRDRIRREATGWILFRPPASPGREMAGFAHSRGYQEYEGKRKWWTAVGDSEEVLFAGVGDLVKRMILSAALVILLVLIGTALSARYYVSPLRRIAHAMAAVGGGDLAARTDVVSSDELGALATRFNGMAAQLQDLYTNLESKVQARTQELEDVNRVLRETQAQMIQSEKLASLGQLSAGVAHEINNPLAFVANNVAVLQRDITAAMEILARYRAQAAAVEAAHPDDWHAIQSMERALDLDFVVDDLPQTFVGAREGLKRVQDIVQNLRDFARLDEAERKEVDLASALDSTLPLVNHLLKRAGIEVVKEYADLPPVPCFPGKLNQVFLNLMVNAIQAIAAARSEGGRLTLRTRQEGDHAVVEIEDNGSGMSPEVAARAFDPFFTTKKQGEGTGLGLSISYGIIRDHGGEIDVRSRPGEGTVFSVRLPVPGP